MERGVLAVAALGYLLVLGLVVPGDRRDPQGSRPVQPGSRRCPPAAPCSSTDGTGAWVEWAVPEVHPVIDGMLDAYPVDHIRAFADFQDLRPGWRAFVEAAVPACRGPPGVARCGGAPGPARLAGCARDRDWVYLEAAPAP